MVDMVAVLTALAYGNDGTFWKKRSEKIEGFLEECLPKMLNLVFMLANTKKKIL